MFDRVLNTLLVASLYSDNIGLLDSSEEPVKSCSMERFLQRFAKFHREHPFSLKFQAFGLLFYKTFNSFKGVFLGIPSYFSQLVFFKIPLGWLFFNCDLSKILLYKKLTSTTLINIKFNSIKLVIIKKRDFVMQ